MSLELNSESIQELILENSLAGYWDWDILNDTEYLSPTFKRMFGYEDHEIENSPESWQKLIFQEDLSIVFTNYEKHVASKGQHPYDQVVRYHHKNGSTVWVRCKGEIVEWTADHKPKRMIGCHVDLTAEKQLQQNLDRATKLNRIALTGAQMGAWELNTATHELIWTPEMYRLFEKNEDDFTPSIDQWMQLVHLDDRAHLKEQIERLKSCTSSLDASYRIVTESLDVKHVKTRASYVEMGPGNAAQIIGISWDITEMVKARQEVETGKNMFEGAFQYSAIGMALISPEGRWIKVNKRVCQITGYSESELMQLTFQDITHPEDLATDVMQVQQMLRNEIETYQMEKRYFHKKGHIIWVLLSVSLAKDSFGKPLHFVSQIKDITQQIHDKKALEENLEVTQKQNDRLLNFAHIVSHNLRSHTGNLGMMLSLLKEDGISPEKHAKALEHITQISESLSSTVKHLTEVVQIQTNFGVSKEVLNLYDYVERSLAAVKADLLKCGAQVDNSVHKEATVLVLFNPAYLDSILLNLVSNSIKYRNPAVPLSISFKASSAQKTMEILVADNGLGIDLRRHGSKVFGLNKTFHAHPDARGVGLFITRNQIEAMNGTISVESQPNKGATFKITIPHAN